jgi:hypothetical protein
MCTTTLTARPGDAIDLSRIDWDIVVVGNPERASITHYRVTCWDRETGTFIGEAIAPPVPAGGPPVITIVEIEAERLAGINRRCADPERQRARGWLRRVPSSVLAEHGIETARGRVRP